MDGMGGSREASFNHHYQNIQFSTVSLEKIKTLFTYEIPSLVFKSFQKLSIQLGLELVGGRGVEEGISDAIKLKAVERPR